MADLCSILLVTIIVSLYIPFGSALAPISNEGCESKCGDVSVPFPFGMGNSDCFLDKWFEVTCNDSVTPPRLLLKLPQLEVLNLSVNKDDLYNEVLVKGPISFFNCTEHYKINQETVALTGSPFSFSQKNLFVTWSCGARANLDSRSGNVFTQIGCTPDCDRNRSVSNYCQTAVPSNLDSYQIEFESDGTGGKECRYAFVASSDYWYGKTTRSKSFAGIRDQGYVPLVLDWEMEYGSYYDLFKEDLTSEFPYCNISSSWSSIKRLIKCYCPYGFRGNPYLSVGCTEDINECDEFTEGLTGWCAPGSTCVNTYGDYYCSFKRIFLVIGFGSSFGALLLLFGLWGSLYKSIKRRKETKRRREFFKQNGGLNLRQKLLSSGEGNIEKTRLFTLDELDKATDHFSIDRILGQGGQGTVYKGMLEDGKIVAVKKSKAFDKSKPSGFINEVLILSQINHRNVVQLLGCCLETEVPILVYEFIPNGTLAQYIHEQNTLTWKTRIRIATEVAGALSYLHSAAAIPIFHRDIKSTNILLDEKYKAKVADFGLSRTVSLEQTHLTTFVAGTFGYLDPEYFQSSQFTEKSDVFSFGVVMAELLTGQKAICSIRVDEGINLATYFTTSMEANALFDILDPQVLEDGPKEDIEVMARLALSCLSLSGRNRPTMKEVAMELEAIQKNEMRSETHSSTGQNQINKEIEFIDFVVPWDVSSGSTRSPLDRSVFQQELPLLSMESD